MKVLWITNIVFPEALDILQGRQESHGIASGGWLLSAASGLIKESSDVELAVASLSPAVKDLKVIEGRHWKYFVIPYGKGNQKYNSEYECFWKRISSVYKPNVIHIWGTEYSHGLAYVRACGADKVVVSIQGLKSVISRYYTAGLTWHDIMANLTVHDLLKGGVMAEKRRFAKTGLLENELLRSVNHVIGRTRWDKAHVLAINPKTTYHLCNEILREEFYCDERWSLEKCTKHSIFLSQAYYPLKGAHFVLKAMPIVKREYPDVTIRIAGDNYCSYYGLARLRHLTSYWKYLERLIRKYKMENEVSFIGRLDARQMKDEYLKANLFICPSSIENSPNSLGEAQILGVPCVASYAGGIPDMMQSNMMNLYRYDDSEMLAEVICRNFRNVSGLDNVVLSAQKRHNSRENTQRLLSIYRSFY